MICSFFSLYTSLSLSLVYGSLNKFAFSNEKQSETFLLAFIQYTFTYKLITLILIWIASKWKTVCLSEMNWQHRSMFSDTFSDSFYYEYRTVKGDKFS